MSGIQFLIIGSGGREHALVEVFRTAGEVFSLGGSDKIREIAMPLDKEGPVSLKEPLPPEMVELLSQKEDMIIVFGPEQPLAEGWVDQLVSKNPNLKILGPSKEKAQLESSKAFCKAFLQRNGIPTPKSLICETLEELENHLESMEAPYVVKADGLAAGKGVGIFDTKEEAKAFGKAILVDGKFGKQSKCLLEEYVEGDERSLFLLLDGARAVQLGIAKDYKRLHDNDQGPNTGGMGAFTPVPGMDGAKEMELFRTIIRPLLQALQKEKLFYRGFLYLGLVETQKGFQVFEINVRLGDPEAEALLPLLGKDFANLCIKAVEGQFPLLSGANNLLQLDSNFWTLRKENSSVTVVLASPGYPENPQVDIPLPGLTEFEQKKPSNLFIFHNGTKKDGEKWITRGGRVLTITAIHPDLSLARQKCYEAISSLGFNLLHFRTDIGKIEIPRKKEGDGKRKPLVSIVMGSASDLPTMKECAEMLEKFGIPFEVRILSAHRSPEKTSEYAKGAEERGIEVIIAGAGGAAHLAGLIAAQTVLPVVSVPMETSSLGGLDSLYSIVQMPTGVPVATMAIGKAGARNGAIMAATILGTAYPEIRDRVRAYKKYLAQRVLEADRNIQEEGYKKLLEEG
ncbi:MAG: phosphoribosylamine--glycine ligase [Planctomycetota bacterium]|nr:MAG: phosphoribosylamine--glycine ligase [Planctomycetota bacterium]